MSTRLPNVSRVPRVLVDTSVLRCGHFAAPRKLTITREERSKLAAVSRGFVRKPRPHNQSSWKERQIERIPTIAYLITQGKIEGLISRQLLLEYRGVCEESRVGNVFVDLWSLKKVRPPIYPSRFDSGIGFDRKGLIRHCERLLLLTPKQAEHYISEFADLLEMDDFEKESFRDISTFHAICEADNSGAHYCDAFHLWTAERNGIDYFCMVERKFPNYIKSQRRVGRVKVKCQVVTPEELLVRLRVRKLVPAPLKDGWFYHFGGGEEKIDPPLRKNRWSWRSFLRSCFRPSPE